MIVLIFLTVVFSVVYAKYLWDRRYLYYYSFKLKGPLSFPFLGSAYVLFNAKKDNVKFLSNLFKKYGNICKLWLGNILVVFTNNPNYIKTILNECIEKEASYQFGKCLIGEGLFTATSKKWKRHRKIIALLFNTKKLNTFFDIFVQHSDKLVKKLEKNVGKDYHVDVFQTIQQSTIDIICEISMGTKMNNEKYGYWMIRAETLVVLRFFLFYLHPDFIWKLTHRYQEVKVLTRNAWEFVRKIVENRYDEKMKDRANNNFIKEPPNCFLDYLREISKDELTNDELIEEIQTLIVAGSGTTSTAESTVLLMLALHQDIQEKVYEELSEIFEGSNRQILVEDLKQMKYLECVIKETLRLFPATPAFARTVERDLVLDNSVTIPKGASVIIPIISVHRNPEIWTDPLKFDPGRFLKDESFSRHPYSFIPFGAGPRNCIGMRYAMIAVKIMLASVIRRFRIVSTEYRNLEEIPLHFKIITKFPKGHKIKLEYR